VEAAYDIEMAAMPLYERVTVFMISSYDMPLAAEVVGEDRKRTYTTCSAGGRVAPISVAQPKLASSSEQTLKVTVTLRQSLGSSRF
jgi:hypothetical protein